MASIERTAYPRFKRYYTVNELKEIYTPTLSEIAFGRTSTTGEDNYLNLIVLLKSFQRLGYFPKLSEIPDAVINYIRTFLIEDNHLNHAVKRSTKVIRFTISESTDLTPFEKHFDRAPRNVFNNLLDLENPGRGLLEIVYDIEGSHLAQNKHDADLMQRMVFNCIHGRSATDEDLDKELQKRQVGPKFQYFVVKNHSGKRMESRFDLKPPLCGVRNQTHSLLRENNK